MTVSNQGCELPMKLYSPQVTAANASRLKWGVAREAVCRALIDRARSLLDKHAIMRKPSLEGIQAMFLLQTMLNSSMWVEEPDRMAMLECECSTEAADCSARSSLRYSFTQRRTRPPCCCQGRELHSGWRDAGVHAGS